MNEKSLRAKQLSPMKTVKTLKLINPCDNRERAAIPAAPGYGVIKCLRYIAGEAMGGIPGFLRGHEAQMA